MRMLQKKYIGIVLLLLVAASASAQKAERDYIRKGNRFFKDSVYVDAEVNYRKALEVNPKSTVSMFNLGNTLTQQNQDQNQDQDKQDQQKEQDKQQDQQKDQQQNQDQQQQPSQPEKKDNEMSKENAEQLLNSVMQDEKDVQDKVKKQQVLQGGRLEKDW